MALHPMQPGRLQISMNRSSLATRWQRSGNKIVNGFALDCEVIWVLKQGGKALEYTIYYEEGLQVLLKIVERFFLDHS